MRGLSGRSPAHIVARTAGVAGKLSCALYLLPSAATAGRRFAFETRQRFQIVLSLLAGSATNTINTCPGATTNVPSCLPKSFGSRYEATQSLIAGFAQLR